MPQDCSRPTCRGAWRSRLSGHESRRAPQREWGPVWLSLFSRLNLDRDPGMGATKHTSTSPSPIHHDWGDHVTRIYWPRLQRGARDEHNGQMPTPHRCELTVDTSRRFQAAGLVISWCPDFDFGKLWPNLVARGRFVLPKLVELWPRLV